MEVDISYDYESRYSNHALNTLILVGPDKFLTLFGIQLKKKIIIIIISREMFGLYMDHVAHFMTPNLNLITFEILAYRTLLLFWLTVLKFKNDQPYCYLFFSLKGSKVSVYWH